MITRQKTRNLGQHSRLLRNRRDTCVYATAVSVATLRMTHIGPHFGPPDASLHYKSHRQSAISQADRQIQSP